MKPSLRHMGIKLRERVLRHGADNTSDAKLKVTLMGLADRCAAQASASAAIYSIAMGCERTGPILFYASSLMTEALSLLDEIGCALPAMTLAEALEDVNLLIAGSHSID